MSSKAEMEMHILMYAHQRLVRGHLKECLSLGFDLEALQIIRTLDLAALTRTDMRRKSGITSAIKLDNKALARLAADLKEQSQYEAVIDRLILKAASVNLVHHFFGIGRQEYSDRKKLLALPPSVPGRRSRRIAKWSEESLILHLLKNALDHYSETERATALVQCQCLLEVATQTGHWIDEVWEISENHQAKGTFVWRDLDRAQSR